MSREILNERMLPNPIWVLEFHGQFFVPSTECYELVTKRDNSITVKIYGGTRTILKAAGRYWFTDPVELLEWWDETCAAWSEMAAKKSQAFADAIITGPRVRCIPNEPMPGNILLEDNKE